MEIEIWKDVPEYEGLYQVSNFGNVKSYKSGLEKILSPSKDSWGYLQLGLIKNLTRKTFKVHKLVAMAFLNHKPCGLKLQVDHINKNILDNNVKNLQILTAREHKHKDCKKGSSKYIGVSFDKSRNKWHSQITINGKNNNLGRFKNEYDAHLAYQNKLKEIEK